MRSVNGLFVVEVEENLHLDYLFSGPPSIVIFFRHQRGLNGHLLRRYLDDLDTSKVRVVYLVDVERNWSLVERLNVQFNPTTIRFDSRREVKRVVGLPPPKVFAGRLGL